MQFHGEVSWSAMHYGVYVYGTFLQVRSAIHTMNYATPNFSQHYFFLILYYAVNIFFNVIVRDRKLNQLVI